MIALWRQILIHCPLLITFGGLTRKHQQTTKIQRYCQHLCKLFKYCIHSYDRILILLRYHICLEEFPKSVVSKSTNSLYILFASSSSFQLNNPIPNSKMSMASLCFFAYSKLSPKAKIRSRVGLETSWPLSTCSLLHFLEKSLFSKKSE